MAAPQFSYTSFAPRAKEILAGAKTPEEELKAFACIHMEYMQHMQKERERYVMETGDFSGRGCFQGANGFY